MSRIMNYGMAGWNRYDTGTRKLPTGVRPTHLDPTTHAQVAIEAEHHEIHEGHMWHLHLSDTTVDIAVPKEILLVTPALNPDVSSFNYDNKDFKGYYVHFAGDVLTTKDANIDFFEGTTVSANGSAIDTLWKNRNRDDSEVLTLVYEDPTVTGDGTHLTMDRVFSATKPQNQVGGSARTSSEWVLKPATNYLIRITVDVNTAEVHLSLDCYEHPHKDPWWEPDVR